MTLYAERQSRIQGLFMSAGTGSGQDSFGPMTYELFYWGGIPGRGEFVRLALEYAGADYREMNREEPDAVAALLTDPDIVTPSFAPPYLRHRDVVVGQVGAILNYLGPLLDLSPEDEVGRNWTLQIQLTIADMVAEAHDVHHPVGIGAYYEDQKAEASRRAEEFRGERIEKFLGWFERVLERNPEGPNHLVGGKVSYADLSLFHLVGGLDYAFPKAMARQGGRFPKVAALAGRIGRDKRLAAYLASDRHLPFDENGIFRHYPELDG